MLYSVYTVLGVCCTLCMLYMEYAVLRVCCTWYILYLVYAVLSVNPWSWHGEIERDDITLCTAMIIKLSTRPRDGGWKWGQYGGYEWIWETRGTTYEVGFRRPHIGVCSGRLGSHTRWIGNSERTGTQNSIKFSFLKINFPSPLITFFFGLTSTIIEAHEVKSFLCITPCLEHESKPSTAHTEYCIIQWLSVSLCQPVCHPVSLGGPCCT